MSWKKRIARDIEDLTKGGFDVTGDDTEDITDLSVFRVAFAGPKDTLYEGGQWQIRFTIPAEYPFKSPSVGFVQNIMHPNVDFASGSICLDALNAKWSPCFTIRHVVESILPYLLAYPNPEDPLNREAAALLKNNPEEYSRRVIALVNSHAHKKK